MHKTIRKAIALDCIAAAGSWHGTARGLWFPKKVRITATMTTYEGPYKPVMR